MSTKINRLSQGAFATLAANVKNEADIYQKRLDDGVSVSEMAKEMGLSRSTLTSALRLAGVKFGKDRPRPEPPPEPASIEELVKMLMEAVTTLNQRMDHAEKIGRWNTGSIRKLALGRSVNLQPELIAKEEPSSGR